MEYLKKKLFLAKYLSVNTNKVYPNEGYYTACPEILRFNIR